MLAPLPRLYRLAVMAAALLVGIGTGVWLAHWWDLPLPLGGLLTGSLGGLAVAFLLVHDFHTRERPARPPRRP